MLASGNAFLFFPFSSFHTERACRVYFCSPSSCILFVLAGPIGPISLRHNLQQRLRFPDPGRTVEPPSSDGRRLTTQPRSCHWQSLSAGGSRGDPNLLFHYPASPPRLRPLRALSVHGFIPQQLGIRLIISG
ncbi:hypothetical protein N656DRAFT_275300 [Canariomyces notabilis]|uniref:Uncharacterized protein n=1 Tax=Canariomyces notabilis TaxID=2074819 RepID=A0AAN6TLT0_9PEZI|nr:hypothetical protein N656DRAFT_275300 [Canariomyces arenarius]